MKSACCNIPLWNASVYISYFMLACLAAQSFLRGGRRPEPTVPFAAHFVAVVALLYGASNKKSRFLLFWLVMMIVYYGHVIYLTYGDIGVLNDDSQDEEKKKYIRIALILLWAEAVITIYSILVVYSFYKELTNPPPVEDNVEEETLNQRCVPS